MRIGTGYLNLVKFFRKHLSQNRNTKVDLCCPAPEANTFTGAKGVKGYSPYVIRMKIFKYVKENLNSDFNVWEYKRRLNLDND